MSSAVERTDELVREYLTYRGFSSALRHLDTEIKADRERGLRVGGTSCLTLPSLTLKHQKGNRDTLLSSDTRGNCFLRDCCVACTCVVLLRTCCVLCTF